MAFGIMMEPEDNEVPIMQERVGRLFCLYGPQGNRNIGFFAYGLQLKKQMTGEESIVLADIDTKKYSGELSTMFRILRKALKTCQNEYRNI